MSKSVTNGFLQEEERSANSYSHYLPLLYCCPQREAGERRATVVHNSSFFLIASWKKAEERALLKDSCMFCFVTMQTFASQCISQLLPVFHASSIEQQQILLRKLNFPYQKQVIHHQDTTGNVVQCITALSHNFAVCFS